MLWENIMAPNAWFAGEKDYRQRKVSGSRTKVLEIATTDYITAAREGLFSLDFKLHLKKSNSSRILFLSAFFHPWNAITRDGKINPRFKEAFENFRKALEDNNVKVGSFSEAYQLYETSAKTTFSDD